MTELGDVRRDKRGGGAVAGVIAAAHELKSPLALTRQLTLALENESLSDSERRLIVERIRLTSERALRLTTNLTKQERLHESFFELEPINPVQLCEDVVSELRPLYRASGRELEVGRRRTSPLVVAHRELLHRVLASLADNALCHTSERAKFTIRQQSASDTVRLTLRDYGPGVPTSLWQDVANGSTRVARRPQSSGLGLVIARQFTEAMGGRLGVIRHRDGASFYVELSTSHQMSFI